MRLLVLLFLVVVVFIVNSHTVLAVSPLPTYAGGTTPGGNPPPAGLKELEVVFTRIINFASTLAIFAFFAMFVVAAFKFLTSGGDPKATESARNTMTYAFIGVIVIVSSYILLSLLSSFTGVKLTSFTIPTL